MSASRFCPSLALVFGLAASAFAQVQVPAPEDVLKTLYRPHPRLFLREDACRELKERIERDATLRRYHADVLAAADRHLTAPALEYRKVSIRLLHVSRACLERTQTLGLAWRLTGDEKYAHAARDNLLAVCAFPDWNPSHFLDTAEMSHAVGLGYDWLHDWLDEPTRATIREGLIRHGLDPGLAAYKNHRFVRNAFNWNQVCNGGLVVGALAIAETHPDYATRIIPAAVESLQRPLRTYEPDGAWGEGVGYWNYATSYTVYGMAAMQSALGTDYGLSNLPGLAKAAEFPLALTGPTGLFFAYADVGERARRGPMACLFWLAGRYGRPDWADAEHELLAGSRHGARPGHLLWYQPPSNEKPLPRTVQRFRGPVEVAVMSGAGEGRDTLWAAVKAGYNRVAHGHLDLGQFELDALGVRWVRDLGADDYDLTSYFGNRRWSYYRLNSQSHSVPLLNGKDQHLDGKAKFLKFPTEDDPRAVLDLSSAYVTQASRVLRGLAMDDLRRGLLVQDEFLLQQPCEISWGVFTDATVTLEGRQATLELEGKQLIARLLAPESASFSIVSAEQEPPQKRNRGVSRLTVRLPNAQGEARIVVLFSPVWPDTNVTSMRVHPLEEW